MLKTQELRLNWIASNSHAIFFIQTKVSKVNPTTLSHTQSWSLLRGIFHWAHIFIHWGSPLTSRYGTISKSYKKTISGWESLIKSVKLKVVLNVALKKLPQAMPVCQQNVPLGCNQDTGEMFWHVALQTDGKAGCSEEIGVPWVTQRSHSLSCLINFSWTE
jgi:hypothetical protein